MKLQSPVNNSTMIGNKYLQFIEDVSYHQIDVDIRSDDTFE